MAKYFYQFKEMPQALKDYLFTNTNILRLTHRPWTEGIIFKQQKGTEKDPLFKKTKELLHKYFIKTITNNLLYDNVPQPKKVYTHYYFTLSKRIQELIITEKLFEYSYPQKNKEHFYALEDPTFYEDNTLVCSVISHEHILTLYITEEEREKLEKQGVHLKEF